MSIVAHRVRHRFRWWPLKPYFDNEVHITKSSGSRIRHAFWFQFGYWQIAFVTKWKPYAPPS